MCPVGTVPVSTRLFTADKSIICQVIFRACTLWLNACKPGFTVQKKITGCLTLSQLPALMIGLGSGHLS